MKKGTPELVDKRIAEHFRQIIQLLGLDISDPNLKETPERLTKMYRHELFGSVGKPLPDMKMFPLKKGTKLKSQMLIERNIKVQSTCAHHFLPVIGFAHVAYIPGSNVVGLSKMHRTVEHFSRKPQLQEDLTNEIGNALCGILGTKDVAVMITAKHFCVKVRGVQDICSDTTTNYVNGRFKNLAVRSEFLNTLMIANANQLY